jgi:hypothetical protein
VSKPSTFSRKSLAQQADKYALYLRSVQEPEHEVWFFDRVYKAEFGQKPRVLREDFCGAAAVCYEWVKRGEERRAIGVDLDPEPLRWGRQHLAVSLTQEQQSRVRLMRADVRDVSGEKADVVAAQNFSFWIFKTRDELRGYFKAALANLGKRGVLVLDIMGGSEMQEDGREDKRRLRGPDGQPGFTYVWHQKRFDPITHGCQFAIHFRFEDGSELRDAFTYDWRLWSIPETRELLLEAGFSRVDVYWEGENRETGRGNGVYNRRSSGTADPSWVTYIVGVK